MYDTRQNKGTCVSEWACVVSKAVHDGPDTPSSIETCASCGKDEAGGFSHASEAAANRVCLPTKSAGFSVEIMRSRSAAAAVRCENHGDVPVQKICACFTRVVSLALTTCCCLKRSIDSSRAESADRRGVWTHRVREVYSSEAA